MKVRLQSTGAVEEVSPQGTTDGTVYCFQTKDFIGTCTPFSRDMRACVSILRSGIQRGGFHGPRIIQKLSYTRRNHQLNTLLSANTSSVAISKRHFASSNFQMKNSTIQKEDTCPIKGADRLSLTGENVWVEFTGLVQKYKPVNLGQGLPEFETLDCCAKALKQTQGPGTVSENQYTRSQGHPRLVKALSDLYSPLFNRNIDPMTEIITTVGAYESLYCIFTSMINPGDEVILIEPYFDCYNPMVLLAGGKPVYVPLRVKENAYSTADMYIDRKELEDAFNERTKAIVVNTPHNPTGKIFRKDELEFIAGLCKKYNSLYISDEVYEWLVYPGTEHFRVATLPGMWERTVTVCSAGKMFSLTGWKIGWVIAPKYLIDNLEDIHKNTVYTVATPLQEALAQGIEEETRLIGQEGSYWKWLQEKLLANRDKLAIEIAAAGMTAIVPEGGYFMLADISKFDNEDDGSCQTKDYQFSKWLIKQKGLATIPTSAFYSKDHRHLGSNYIRLCFIKEDETLQKAGVILKNLSK